jgi:DMSO reductase anchor subunit
VLAIALCPVGAAYLWTVHVNAQLLAGLLGVVLIALAMGTLYCTAMIYACLKTVPSWNVWQTRLSYPLLGLASGGVCLITLAPRLADAQVGRLVIALLVAGALLKYSAWKEATRALPGLGAALNLSGRVRMLDAGHTGPTFLTREFGYQLKEETGRQLRWLALALAFVLPVLLISAGSAWAVLALMPCLAGLGIERWLFFAQARHVVRTYHGLA